MPPTVPHNKIALISKAPPVAAPLIHELQRNGEEVLLMETADERIKNCFVTFICPDFVDSESLEEINRIKQVAQLQPIVLIGKVTSQNDIVEALRLGVSDFLIPPLQPDTIFNCISRIRLAQPLNGSNSKWKKFLPWNWFRKREVAYGIVSPAIVEAYQPPKKTTHDPKLQVQMLGEFSLSVNDKTLCKLPGKKAKSVLAYILYDHPKPVHREVLIDVFWKDSIPDSARNCLNVTLHNVRKHIDVLAPGKNVIIFKDECYSINPDFYVEKDVDLFKSYWNNARQTEINQGMKAAVNMYHQAFAFYRGDFLEQMRYEEWTERSRDWFKETWIVILDRLTTHFYENGKYQICLNLCQKILEKDACLEDVHRRMMVCHSKMRMKDLALRQFYKCQKALKEGLDIMPGKATVELYHKIKSS